MAADIHRCETMKSTLVSGRPATVRGKGGGVEPFCHRLVYCPTHACRVTPYKHRQITSTYQPHSHVPSQARIFICATAGRKVKRPPGFTAFLMNCKVIEFLLKQQTMGSAEILAGRQTLDPVDMKDSLFLLLLVPVQDPLW